jgi:cell division protease FtsH
MITVYGMNAKVGNISFYDPAQDNTFTKPYSEETGKMIDEEVRKLIAAAYEKTKALLVEKKRQVEILAKELLVKEVLFQSDVETLIGHRPFDDKKHEEENGEEDQAGENHQGNGAISAGVPPYDSSITSPAPKPAP